MFFQSTQQVSELRDGDHVITNINEKDGDDDDDDD